MGLIDPTTLRWRFIITDLDSKTLTILDRYSINRSLRFALDEPASAEGEAFSDESEVNIAHSDGDAFLSEGNRLLYCFRREGPDTPRPAYYEALYPDAPWVCRFGGIILGVEDTAGDSPRSHFTAFDPWQYLMTRPLVDDLGAIPTTELRCGSDRFAQTRADLVIQALLTNSYAAHGGFFLDWTTGTIDVLSDLNDAGPPAFVYTFQGGMTIGEALNQLVQQGVCDLTITPYYDPGGKPGVVGRLNVHHAGDGTIQNAAIFAWDQPSRSLVEVNYAMDGTERANKLLYRAGVGGAAGAGAIATDAASVAKYGQYWQQRDAPAALNKKQAQTWAAANVLLARNGGRTLTISPAAERSPDPFSEYWIGDYVPVYYSNRLRQAMKPTKVGGAWTNIPRVYELPITVDDNGTERVEGLTLGWPGSA